MQILQASELGMCFGVRDALAALDRIADPRSVTIHGELVHNGEVLDELDRRGFHRTPEDERPLPATATVMVTAHGISDAERRRLEAAGKRLVDTTCPLVQKAHDAAQELEREGRRVVVIGRPRHVEVVGLTGDLRDPIVVAGEDDVRSWPNEKLGVVCQTTTPEALRRRVVAAIRRANPDSDVRELDTICSPTKARVAALRELVDRVDVLIAVGGRHSNNTWKLVETARRHGVTAHRVENAAELRAEWFASCRIVGLTAGTSTLDRTIAEVRARLEAIARRGSR